MPHYYSQEQESKPILKPISVNIRGISLKLVTSSGVFSKKRIDKGTEHLIKTMIIQPGWKILDLGCGYGAIGLFAAKLSNTSPYLIDINKRACQIAKINAKTNNRDATILNGSLYDPVKDIKFDTILINPPQTAGKDVCFAMISGSKQHLNMNGLLQLVARPNKGGRTLSKKMEEVFGNIDIPAKSSGYSVYISRK